MDDNAADGENRCGEDDASLDAGDGCVPLEDALVEDGEVGPTDAPAGAVE